MSKAQLVHLMLVMATGLGIAAAGVLMVATSRSAQAQSTGFWELGSPVVVGGEPYVDKFESGLGATGGALFYNIAANPATGSKGGRIAVAVSWGQNLPDRIDPGTAVSAAATVGIGSVEYDAGLSLTFQAIAFLDDTRLGLAAEHRVACSYAGECTLDEPREFDVSFTLGEGTTEGETRALSWTIQNCGEACTVQYPYTWLAATPEPTPTPPATPITTTLTETDSDAVRVWGGNVDYSDATARFKILANSVDVIRGDGVAEVVMTAFLSYSTVPVGSDCEELWIKKFIGTGKLDSEGVEIVFSGTETVTKYSHCSEGDDTESTTDSTVRAVVNGDRWEGVVFDSPFSVESVAGEEYGVVERDGNLYINAPPGGVLEISRLDLPMWAAAELAVMGAMVATAGPPSYIDSGDHSVLLDGVPVARVGDPTSHGGVVAEGSPKIFVNGRPAAVVGGAVVSGFQGSAVVPAFNGIIVTLGSIDWDRISRKAVADRMAPIQAWAEATERYLDEQLALGFLDEPASAGDTTIEIDPTGFEAGDAVVVGNIEGPTEVARVVSKGSLVLDRPLIHDYPAGTFVTPLPTKAAAFVPLLAETVDAETVDGDGDDGRMPIVPISLGVALLGALIGIVAWRRRHRATPSDSIGTDKHERQ